MNELIKETMNVQLKLILVGFGIMVLIVFLGRLI